ncbi:MAG: hypothetical protein ACI9NQ_000965 [Paracoccaceae bacterium]|jgi:hypothetical protein
MGSDFSDINNDGWFDYLSTDMSATTHFKQKTMMGAMTGRFLETAFFSGLDSTDWTWSGVFGDLMT